MSVRTLPLRILAAVLVLLPCYALVRHTPMPPAMAVSFAALTVASALWPAACLTVVAGLVPLVGTLASLWSLSFRWSEAIVIAFLAGAISRLLLRPALPLSRAGPLTRAAAVFAAIVTASWLVELVMLQYTTDFPGHFARVVWQMLTRDFFRDPGAFLRLNDALLLLEGVALAFCVTRFAGTHQALPRAILRMTVVAATAAAALNAQRLTQIALQHGGGWGMLFALAKTTRVSVLHTDLNAAGSYFAMALPVALGLGVERRRQVGWLVPALAIACAIWLTGSRTAIAAGGLMVIVFLGASSRIIRTPARRRGTMIALIVALAAILFVVVQYPQNRNTSTSIALDVRADMARATFGMFKARPVFGVGVGNFWQRSGEYMPARLKGVYAHENAHNNFLQILAELGLAGLAAFLAVLAAAARPLRWPRGPDALLVAGALSGVLAFLLTCLTGHPLLSREVAYPFWLLFGATAALRMAEGSDSEEARMASGRRELVLRTAPAALVAVIALTIPFRVKHEKLTRTFEDVSIGYSQWTSADDGVRFRWAQRRSRFFISSTTPYVLIPLRLGPQAQESSVVTVRLDGRAANTVQVIKDRWTLARVVLAAGRLTPRYRLIELEVGGSGNDTELMVGRPGL